jgi:hypothetical protein
MPKKIISQQNGTNGTTGPIDMLEFIFTLDKEEGRKEGRHFYSQSGSGGKDFLKKSPPLQWPSYLTEKLMKNKYSGTKIQ